MSLVLADRVQQTASANTTVSFTLTGSVNGYQSFAVIGNGNTTFYSATDASGNWECGIGTYSTTGPTLTRTTILSSSNSGSAVTFSGTVNVFVTYPSEKSVNLDGSGNVSALGTVSSGVWQGTTVAVGYGGTGVTASSGTNSVVLRDSNANITANNIFLGYTSTATSGGTTTLTAASTQYQRFTGTTTQTVKLPDATTLQKGFIYTIDNDSTGNLTVVDNASTTLDTIVGGSIDYWTLLDNSTSAGTWIAYSLLPSTYDFSATTASFGNATITNATWNGGTVGVTYGGTGLNSISASNYAIYSSAPNVLTAGTLPVPAGGTGLTSLTANYIPYGNGTGALNNSANFSYNGTYLLVGSSSALGGATNPIMASVGAANNYVQSYIYNTTNNANSSSDFVAYPSNGSDSSGWVDMGITSSAFSQATYAVTGPNEAYLFGSSPSAAGTTVSGNLVYATDAYGSTNAHQFYVGGFTQSKSSWKAQIDSTGLKATQVNATNGLHVNSQTVSASYSIPSGSSAMSAGPISVASAVSVTIPAGSRWVIL